MNSSIQLKRTNSADPDLPPLITHLDTYLNGIYGERMKFFNQFNGLEDIKQVVIAYLDGEAVGSAAIKYFDADTMELKRMIIVQSARQKGIGRAIVAGLLEWAKELGAKRVILETGYEMPGAMVFYQRAGFELMDNYGPYVGVEESRCFEMELGG